VSDLLRELLDKQAIAETVYRYCRGVDRLDADEILSAYFEDGYDDHGELKGTAGEFVEQLIPLLRERYLSTSHNICNQLIEITGDTMLCESYLIAVHLTASGGQEYQEVVYGRYVDRLERRGGQWRIVHRVVVLDSRNTKPVEPSRLATDPTQLPRGQRDTSDPLYRQRELAAPGEVANAR
jgi:hypothetical protein